MRPLSKDDIITPALPEREAAGVSPWQGATSLRIPPVRRKGGMAMVTYDDLIQIGILIVGIINLFLQVIDKKK